MSDAEKSGLISKMIGDKKRWRAYKARVRQLPENYRTAVDAIERYVMHFVPTDGDSAASEFEDLADLFEQAAADGPRSARSSGRPGGVRRGVRPELHGGWLRPRPCAKAAD